MNSLSWIEIIYWGATIIGGTLFLLRTIMFLIGGGVDHDGLDLDTDLALDGDYHLDLDHTDAIADSDFSFKFLSLQGLTAFFMMFGLIGLALLRAGLPVLLTIAGGVLAGLFAVWVISLLFSQVRRLQSDGTLDINNALGQKGKVYLTIPANDSGQVHVPVQGTLRIFDAVSEDGKRIKTGATIEVVAVSDSNTLVVKQI